jgi:hypothetical protein
MAAMNLASLKIITLLTRVSIGPRLSSSRFKQIPAGILHSLAVTLLDDFLRP